MELQGVKTTKGMTKAEINKLLEKIKNTKAQKFTARRAKLAGKEASDAAKVASGAGAALTALDKYRKKNSKPKKAVKKRGFN
jgi:GTP cyclohydrolase III